MAGSGFMWGSFSLYLISYLKIYDSSLKTVDGFFCMGIVIFGINAIATLGVYLEKRFGYKRLYVIAIMSLIVGYLLLFFSKTIILDYFILTYIGFSSGLIVS